jgi:predicted  nucleic acid-binding Zn-ribbon protein
MLAERKKAYKAKLPAIQNDSRLNKIKHFREQQSELIAEFEAGQKEFNVEIFASSEELDVLRELKNIGDKIKKIGGAADSELIEKYQLLSGITQWEIEKDIVPRTWAIKREIKDLDQSLADSDQAYMSLKQTFKNAPASFDGFEKRINERFSNLKKMRTNIKGIINDQESYIKGLALKELDLQKLRLENYNMRVKFALARLYDSLVKVEERGE